MVKNIREAIILGEALYSHENLDFLFAYAEKVGYDEYSSLRFVDIRVHRKVAIRAMPVLFFERVSLEKMVLYTSEKGYTLAKYENYTPRNALL